MVFVCLFVVIQASSQLVKSFKFRKSALIPMRARIPGRAPDAPFSRSSEYSFIIYPLSFNFAEFLTASHSCIDFRSARLPPLDYPHNIRQTTSLKVQVPNLPSVPATTFSIQVPHTTLSHHEVAKAPLQFNSIALYPHDTATSISLPFTESYTTLPSQ